MENQDWLFGLGIRCWFEFLIYHGDRDRFFSFASVRKADGNELPHGRYFFLDVLVERRRIGRRAEGSDEAGAVVFSRASLDGNFADSFTTAAARSLLRLHAGS